MPKICWKQINKRLEVLTKILVKGRKYMPKIIVGKGSSHQNFGEGEKNICQK